MNIANKVIDLAKLPKCLVPLYPAVWGYVAFLCFGWEVQKDKKPIEHFQSFKTDIAQVKTYWAPELKILLIAPCIEFPNISPNCWGAKAQESREPVALASARISPTEAIFDCVPSNLDLSANAKFQWASDEFMEGPREPGVYRVSANPCGR